MEAAPLAKKARLPAKSIRLRWARVRFVPEPDSITVSWAEATPAADIGGYSVLIDGTNAFYYGVVADGGNFCTATE